MGPAVIGRSLDGSRRCLPAHAGFDEVQHLAGQTLFRGGVVHDRGARDRLDAPCAHRVRFGGVFVVDDEHVAESGEALGDARAAHVLAEFAHELGGGAAEGASAHEGADRDTGPAEARHALADPGDGEDRRDANDGVRGAEDDSVGLVDGARRVGGGRGVGASFIGDAGGDRLALVLDEVALEGEGAAPRRDGGAKAVVGGGREAAGHAEAPREVVGDLREGEAVAEHTRSEDVGGEVEVA